MKHEFDHRLFAEVISALIQHGVSASTCARSATKYVSEKLVVRATWRFKPRAGNSRQEIAVTYGEPNFLERAFVARCKKAGEPFPVKKVQFSAYPKPRAKK